MTGLSLNLRPNIAAFAAGRGLWFSPEEITNLSDTLNSMCRVSDDKHVTFTLGQGRTGTLDDALDLYGAGIGKPAPTLTAASSIPAGATATERAVATNRAAREGSAALKRRQAEELVSTYGSPWGTTGNLTHASFIQNVHPELATRLRAEAGVRR